MINTLPEPGAWADAPGGEVESLFEVKEGSQQTVDILIHRQPDCQSIPGVKGGGLLYLVLVVPAFAGTTLKMSPAAFACGS